MTRMLCLWLPNWAIQRAIRCRPELKGRPVALVVRVRAVVKSQLAAARPSQQGVRPGMPLVEAQSLVRELGTCAL